jgi:hypothetical protein
MPIYQLFLRLLLNFHAASLLLGMRSLPKPGGDFQQFTFRVVLTQCKTETDILML